MKKFGLLITVLAAVVILGTAAYAAVAPAPKTVPAKKAEVKLITVFGTITTVDKKTRTFTLKEANAAAEMTFKASAKLIKALTAGENVVVGYKKLASGENEAVVAGKFTAPEAVPAKKVEGKLTNLKGTITAVDVKTGTFNLKVANAVAEMTFKAGSELIERLSADEKVEMGYKKLASGENEVVYVRAPTPPHN